jgi:hypothetical protein
MVLSTDDPVGFRQKLIHAFPPRPFYGRVSTHRECDDGIALIDELPGKRWDEVPAAFVEFNSGSLSLLEPAALVAFLPAWLLLSMETVIEQSVLAEFTMYFLCPGSEDEGWQEEELQARVALFDSAQRTAVAEFLQSILSHGALQHWFPYAKYGLKWWTAK